MRGNGKCSDEALGIARRLLSLRFGRKPSVDLDLGVDDKRDLRRLGNGQVCRDGGEPPDACRRFPPAARRRRAARSSALPRRLQEKSVDPLLSHLVRAQPEVTANLPS